jgi:MOSC domain-containing protein YiiM
MKIIAINVGKVTEYKDLIASPAKVFKSAIDKSPVSSLDNSRPLRVSYLGLYGDEQADSRVHGGCDKALYAYPLEHYSFWEGLTEKEMRINVSFSFGHFGENLTVSGLTEHEVWVGDIWFIGDTELRVTKLREPCFKFNVKMNFSKAAKTMIQTAKSGWYLRVIKEGIIQAGDPIKVVHGPKKMSIKSQNDLLLAKGK